MGELVKIDVLKIDGSKSGEQVQLPAEIFEVEPNDHVIWLAIKAEMNHKRQGNSATKNRSAARGGGRKPWRQKGRGTARAGTIRSPLWVGGGRIFGPTPRQYNTKLPKKVRRLARRSVLSYKANDKKIVLVEDFTFDAPKTKQLAEVLKGLKLDTTKTLLLTSGSDQVLYLSGRNLPVLSVREAKDFSAYDVLNADTLLIQKSAIEKISEVLGK
jgi:large subunit ribosomal protein L4